MSTRTFIFKSGKGKTKYRAIVDWPLTEAPCSWHLIALSEFEQPSDGYWWKGVVTAWKVWPYLQLKESGGKRVPHGAIADLAELLYYAKDSLGRS